MDINNSTSEAVNININNTPPPNAENPISSDVNPEKNFLENTEPPVAKVIKVSPNFPNRKRGSKVSAGNVIRPQHRIVFQNYKDQGFKSLAKAIRKTGVYSEGVAKRVNLITKSKSWNALMAEYMPEEFLAQRHSELLDKRDTVTLKNADGSTTRVDNGPETAAVTKGLELAYKLRGSFTKEDKPPASTVMYNLFYKPEIREQMRVFEDGIKQSLLNEINKKNVEDNATEEENNRNLNEGGEGSADTGSAEGQ